jgi:hypothetical protein
MVITLYETIESAMGQASLTSSRNGLSCQERFMTAIRGNE